MGESTALLTRSSGGRLTPISRQIWPYSRQVSSPAPRLQRRARRRNTAVPSRR